MTPIDNGQLSLELKKLLKSDVDFDTKVKAVGKELFSSESLTEMQLRSAKRVVYISIMFD